MKIEERINILKPLVSFNENEFIFCQIFSRRKDNPELDLSVKRLKSYSFYSWEELEEQLPRIQEICDINNARAYIRLNKQNSIDVSLRCISEMSDNIRNGNSNKNKKVWDSVSGKGGSKDWWLLDLDKEHLEFFCVDSPGITLPQLILLDLYTHYNQREGIDSYQKPDEIKYPIVFNFTKTGIHIICKPFDTRILNKYNKELSTKGQPIIQILKDCNTVLCIGENNK